MCTVDDFSRVFTSILIPQLDQRLAEAVNILLIGTQAFCGWKNWFLFIAGREGFLGSWNFEGGLAEPSW